MNHRKTLAALLASALILSVCGGAVIATETADTTQTPLQDQLLIAPAPPPLVISPAPGSTSQPESTLQTSTDPDGTISFPNVAQRVREGNLTARALGSSIAAIEALDYEVMSEDLRKGLNQLASTAYALYTAPMGAGIMMAESVQQQYNGLRDQFDAIKKGEFQQDNDETIWMLQSTQNQMAMAGESLYIALIELQQSTATLDRNLSTLDRGLAELDVRYAMGQVSSLTLQETNASKTSLLSTRQSLLSNYEILMDQLQAMLGEDLSAPLTLAPLPSISNEELAAMDLEADLAKAKQASYSLHDAKNTLEDAKDEYQSDSNFYLEYHTATYRQEMAYHQLEAAKRTYEATVQNFELSFRTLYHQIKDYQQVLNAAKSALAVKENSYAAAQIRYEQGVISQFDLLDAQDAVAAAKDTVNSAAIDLFTAYNNYRWAVDYGILN